MVESAFSYDAVNIKCFCCGRMIPAEPVRRALPGEQEERLFCSVACYDLYLDYNLGVRTSEPLQRPSKPAGPAMRVAARFVVEGKNQEEVASALADVAEVVQVGRHPRAGNVAVDVEAADLTRIRALDREIGARLGGAKRLSTQYVP